MKLNMAVVEADKKLCSTERKKFTWAANNFNQAIDIAAPTKTIESTYDELRAAWSKAQKKHNDFVKLLPGEELGEDWIKKLSKTSSKLELHVKTDSYSVLGI